MRYPLLSTVTRAESTGERRRRRNPNGIPPEADELARLIRQADQVYTQLYNLRRRYEQAVGMGYVRRLPFPPAAQERARELQREHTRLQGRIRRLRKRLGAPNPYTEVHADGDRVAYWRDPRRTQVTVTSRDTRPDNPRRRRGRNPAALTRVRVIPSHSGLARFMAQLEGPIGSIPRQVYTPYSYGPTHVVWDWRGAPVIIAETRHKRYEVFRVEGPIGPVERDNPIWVEWTAPDPWTGRPRQRKALWSRHVSRRRERGAAAFVERQRRDPEVTAARWYTTSRQTQGNPRPVPPASKLETLRRIVAHHQAMRLGAEGSVDAFTASTILAVYDRLSPENQAKYLAMPVRRMADVAWKLARSNPRPRRAQTRRAVTTTRTTTRTVAGNPLAYVITYRDRQGRRFYLTPEATATDLLEHAARWPSHAAAREAAGRENRTGVWPRGWRWRALRWLDAAPRANPRRRARARFCPERVADPRRFDRRSLRTVVAKGHRVTVGCPRGQYDARRRRCRTATRAQRVLHPAGEGRCPLGGRELRGNPDALCALCRREPRAAASPYCAPCLRRIHGRRNPPRAGVVIYDRLVELRAVKGRRSHFPGEPFKHAFGPGAKVIGLADGSVLLKGPKPLWDRVQVR